MEDQEEKPILEDQPGQETMPHDEGTSFSSLHDQVHEFIVRVDSFRDEHQEFDDSVKQRLEEIRTRNATILANQSTITAQMA